MNIFPEKQSYRAKLTIILVSAGIFCAAILYFGIFTVMKRIKNIEDGIVIGKIEEAKAYKKILGQKTLMSNLKMYESDVERIDSVFVNKNRILEFITTLEGVAADNNIDQKIVLNSDASAAPSFTKIPISLSLSGTFLDIMNSMKELERLDFYIDIYSLSLEAAADKINAAVSANIFIK